MSIIRLVQGSNPRALYRTFVSCLLVAATVTAASANKVKLDKEINVMRGERYAMTGPDTLQNVRYKKHSSIAVDAKSPQKRRSQSASSIDPSYNKANISHNILKTSSNGHEFDDDEGDNSTMFNITDALRRGIQAQYEFCDRVCNGTGTQPLQEEPDCEYLTPVRCSKCYCDEACKMYGDCCPSLGSDGLQHIGERGPHSCLEVNLGPYTNSVQVIGSCPSSYKDLSRGTQNCTRCGRDSSVSSELVVSLDTYAIYCNLHCAVCNGETNFTAIPQTPCADTPEKTVGDEMLSEYDTRTYSLQQFGVADTTQPDTVPSNDSRHVTSCYQSLAHYWPKVRKACVKKVSVATEYVSTCNKTITSNHMDGDILEGLCRQYSYPVFTQSIAYRNLFCALCNGAVPTRKTCNTYRRKMSLILYSGVHILTSLQPIYTYYYDMPWLTQCQDGQWYDYVLVSIRVCWGVGVGWKRQCVHVYWGGGGMSLVCLAGGGGGEERCRKARRSEISIPKAPTFESQKRKYKTLKPLALLGFVA